ncbi:MAG: phosphatase PAP2 family protein [Lachnospiraceae bacterium]|nr:phosphatase PAP2 family protein [Lachnospiraceae bacterium]MDE7183236.1 phosphatase PAP2 family protein [Lachnospiraceae bacterium]
MLSVDGQILLFIQEHIRNAVCDVFFVGITHLGDAGIFWIVLTIGLLCFQRTRRAGIFSVCALLGSLIVNNILLKNVIGRVRPYEVVTGLQCIVAPAVDASFPSGHTGTSFASAVSIYDQLPKKYAVLLMILAALIAFSRLYVGIHYPTDVLGGLVTGIGIGLLVNRIGNKMVGFRKG